MKRFLLIALTSAIVLAGCHNAKKENIEPPTKLTDLKPTVQVTRVWKSSVGDGAVKTGVRLRPEVVDGVLYAASADGDLVAINADTGSKIWSQKSKTHGWFGWGDRHRPDGFLAGGPTVAGDLLVVGTLDGHVYGINTKDGTKRWTAEVTSEVISAPAIVSNLVVVRTNDGRLYGLDSTTGERRWAYDQTQVPTLSLRGNGPLLVANGVIFFGSDNGKLVALRLDNGEKLWEQALSSGEGRTEIDRLNDADGGVVLDGNTLYGGAYHGQLVAIDGPSGRPLWNHPFSTFVDLDVHGTAVFGVDDQSNVWAFDKSGGADMWKQDALKWRQLSGPSAQGEYVVAGDLEGYVHWMQVGDGKLAARERLSKKAIRAQPVVVGNTVYVEDVEGHIGAYRIATP
jgi:outer membrane protein assembly factor BamB